MVGVPKQPKAPIGNWSAVTTGQEAFERAEWFLKTYFNRTYSATSEERQAVRIELRALLPNETERVFFYKKICLHMLAQVSLRASWAIIAFARERHAKLVRATHALHEKAESLYGSRAIEFRIRIADGDLASPGSIRIV